MSKKLTAIFLRELRENLQETLDYANNELLENGAARDVKWKFIGEPAKGFEPLISQMANNLLGNYENNPAYEQVETDNIVALYPLYEIVDRIDGHIEILLNNEDE